MSTDQGEANSAEGSAELDMERLEEIARELEGCPRFRVLREFKERDSFGDLGGEKTGSVAVLDFETTGLEPTDKAIELGIVKIEYGMDSRRLGRVLDRYSGIEDPGFELPEHITKLTGITTEDVRGKSFDVNRVSDLITSCNVVVSHNADFDRGVGERRFDVMSTRPWACSMADVPWIDAGFGGVRLEFIAFKMGIFYGAHRGVVDCSVTAEVLSREVMDGHSGFWWMMRSANEDWYRVWATEAPYARKAILKARGYKWCDGPQFAQKAWRITTLDPDAECEFLREHVLGPGRGVLVEEIGKRNRFTERRKDGWTRTL